MPQGAYLFLAVLEEDLNKEGCLLLTQSKNFIQMVLHSNFINISEL